MFDNFRKGDFVVLREDENQKPLIHGCIYRVSSVEVYEYSQDVEFIYLYGFSHKFKAIIFETTE